MPTIMLLVGSVLCVVFYLYVYFAAEVPRKGTLEWVSMYEKPQMTRSILHKLTWNDILWCALVLLGAAVYQGLLLVGPMLTALEFSGLLALLLSAELALNYLFPMVLSSLLIYLLVKLLTGKAGTGLLSTALFLCTIPINDGTNSVIAAPFLLGSLLCLLLWLHHDGYRCWLSLVSSAALLGLALWIEVNAVFFLLPWLITLVFGEVLRIKKEDRSAWHLLLTLLCAIGVMAAAYAAVIVLTKLPFYTQMLLAPNAFSHESLQHWITEKLDFLQLCFNPYLEMAYLLLPALCLLLAGIPALIHGISQRHDIQAAVLLIFSGFAVIFYCFTPLNLITPMAALVLAYLTNRIRIRKFPGVAAIVGVIPVLITILTTILTLMEV